MVVLLGPRVEELVATVLELETRKRSRFPPGLEPRAGAATATGGVGTANGDKVKRKTWAMNDLGAQPGHM